MDDSLLSMENFKFIYKLKGKAWESGGVLGEVKLNIKGFLDFFSEKTRKITILKIL